MIKGVKICGVTDSETLKFILSHPFPPKFIGFICNYKKSKRYVSYEHLRELTNINKKGVFFVSVLVNPDDEILEKINNLPFDYYQLYDVEPERTEVIKNKYKKKIISALTIENMLDIKRYKIYENISDIILFDGKGYEKSISFDHKLLSNVSSSIEKMIAGNINIYKLPQIKNMDYIIDISGALENKNGKKDIHKIDYFLNTIKKNET